MALPIKRDVTDLLRRISAGDKEASEQLFETVYRELRRMAGRAMRGERLGHTLQPTALVHEAFVRLVGDPVSWVGRQHFFAVAATTMRRVLIDYARTHDSKKRQGGVRVDLDSVLLFTEDRAPEMIALDRALQKLEAVHPRACRVVELQFFAGMNPEETAGVLDVSSKTVQRDWKLARAWLHAELEGGSSKAPQM
jgi:RNA polymerase sigma-70 factor (ECF subfamily)